mgnify:CR=1 FL=1
MKLTFIIETDDESGWLTATCPALPGCITQAETEKELIANIKEAVSLWFEAQEAKEMPAVCGSKLELALSI